MPAPPGAPILLDVETCPTSGDGRAAAGARAALARAGPEEEDAVVRLRALVEDLQGRLAAERAGREEWRDRWNACEPPAGQSLPGHGAWRG